MECYKDNVMLPYVSMTNETLILLATDYGIRRIFTSISMFVVRCSLFVVSFFLFNHKGHEGGTKGHKRWSVVSLSGK